MCKINFIFYLFSPKIVYLSQIYRLAFGAFDKLSKVKNTTIQIKRLPSWEVFRINDLWFMRTIIWRVISTKGASLSNFRTDLFVLKQEPKARRDLVWILLSFLRISYFILEPPNEIPTLRVALLRRVRLRKRSTESFATLAPSVLMTHQIRDVSFVGEAISLPFVVFCAPVRGAGK